MPTRTAYQPLLAAVIQSELWQETLLAPARITPTRASNCNLGFYLRSRPFRAVFCNVSALPLAFAILSFAEALLRGSALLVHSRLTFGVEAFAALFSGFLVLSFAAGAVAPSLVIL